MSEAKPAIPLTEAEAVAVAETLGMQISENCMPGILANLALLDRHADRLFAERSSPCG